MTINVHHSHRWAAGECTGFGGSELAMVEGSIAGYAAIGQNEKARQLFAQRQRYRLFAHLLEKSFNLRAELKTLARPETIFCRCEDVTLIRLPSVVVGLMQNYIHVVEWELAKEAHVQQQRPACLIGSCLILDHHYCLLV